MYIIGVICKDEVRNSGLPRVVTYRLFGGGGDWSGGGREILAFFGEMWYSNLSRSIREVVADL